MSLAECYIVSSSSFARAHHRVDTSDLKHACLSKKKARLYELCIKPCCATSCHGRAGGATVMESSDIRSYCLQRGSTSLKSPFSVAIAIAKRARSAWTPHVQLNSSCVACISYGRISLPYTLCGSAEYHPVKLVVQSDRKKTVPDMTPFPGSARKKSTAKAKRSRRTRQRRTMLRPQEYNKVKVRTASGGSLTIRYRRRPSFSSHEAEICFTTGPKEAETLTSYRHESDPSLCDYASMDESRAFEDLSDLSENSQSSCHASGRIASEASITNLHDCDTSCDFWSDSNIDFLPTGRPDVAMQSIQSLLELETDQNCCSWPAALQDVEQTSEDLLQLLMKPFVYHGDGNEVSSIVSFMEGPGDENQLTEGGFWSTSPSCQSSLTDLNSTGSAEGGQLNMESSALVNMSMFSPPPALDEMESSDVELIDLPPRLCYENAGTICWQDEYLERYELPYDPYDIKATPNGWNFHMMEENAKPFDGSTLLHLDEPEDVNVANSCPIPQQRPNWGAMVMESALQHVERVEIEDPLENVLHLKEAVYRLVSRDHKLASMAREPAGSDVGEAGSFMFCLLDSATTRGKSMRKKRLRRATPLHTFNSLLKYSSNKSEDPASDQPLGSYQNLATPACLAHDRRRRRHGNLLPQSAVSTLRRWFDDHAAFPFAEKKEKLELVYETGLTLTQVENWLSNQRHKLKIRKSDYVYGAAPSEL
ncbi:hypothetical protein GOP47_0002720 [Adiantum capillus-veneris]|uniref:Homeobox domain-containing protein n=1 Tax=Adiantum capillus-veneris TaxID=13818 RepID=A0A9D4VCL8_ADICA|nr:hypothetical protein GOP47_0002720 [Adiantum capillus-veneris]